MVRADVRRVWLAAILATSLASAVAPPTGYGNAVVGPRAGRDYLVDPPAPLWRAARWPLVVALAASADQLQAAFAQAKPLTHERGALLLALVGGDEVRLQTVINAVAATQPVLKDQVFLLASGALGPWTWQQVLGHPGVYAGFVTLDGQVPATLEPVPGQPPTVAGKACLLVSTPEKADSSRRLEQSLARWGLSCAIKSHAPADLPVALGAALSALLPPTPPRAELTDSVTGAHLKAPLGWHCERRDGLLAIVKPDDPDVAVVVEVVTGKLGKRSFESYVESSRGALRQRGLKLRDDLRLTPDTAASPVHAFAAVDSRGPDVRGVYWLLVGNSDRLVSLRAVGAPAEVEAHAEELKALALGVTFD